MVVVLNDAEPETYCGGCHCGAVRFCATGKPVIVAHCHCEDCQRLSGAGHSTGAVFAKSNVQITGEYKSYNLQANNGNQVTKGFCAICGSNILGHNDGSENFITLNLGTFDDASMFEPEVTIFTRNQKPWDKLDDTLATFDTQPEWTPGKN